MSEVKDEKWTREDRLRRIRGLIDQANDAGVTEAERESFLAKADEMMTKYTIEMWELEFAKPAGQREAPIFRVFESPKGSWEYRQAALSILKSLAKLARCRMDWKWNPSVYGYEADINYLEMMYTSALLHAAQHLNPKVEPGRTWIANMAFLRWGGANWQSIHYELSSNATDYIYKGKPWGRGIGTRFTNEMRKYAQEVNRPVVKASNTERWREGFMYGIVQGVSDTVARLRGEQEQLGGLVLAGRSEAIDELYFTENPSERPHPDECDCDTCHRYRKGCRDASCQRRVCIEARKPIKQSKAARYEDKTDYVALHEGRRRGAEINLARGAMPHNPKEVK
jgi:hypothetical protein